MTDFDVQWVQAERRRTATRVLVIGLLIAIAASAFLFSQGGFERRVERERFSLYDDKPRRNVAFDLTDPRVIAAGIALVGLALVVTSGILYVRARRPIVDR